MGWMGLGMGLYMGRLSDMEHITVLIILMKIGEYWFTITTSIMEIKNFLRLVQGKVLN